MRRIKQAALKVENDEDDSKWESCGSDSDDGHIAYAPSAPAVYGAALDLLLPVLFNFHLFTWSTNNLASATVSPKVYPVFFFNIIIIRSIFPMGKRRRFWGTLKYTMMAPCFPVSFRDDVVGELLTSVIRPFQDICFAFFYHILIIFMLLTSRRLSDATLVLERSWMLHNLIFPLAAILTLWWKFLQTLRVWYDTKRRLPHMGNAFKYLSATLIIIYGIVHPENRRSYWWLLLFLLAVLYQICYDVIFDWELFIIVPISSQTIPSLDGWIMSPTSRNSNYSLCRPFIKLVNVLKFAIASQGQGIALRETRLFKKCSFYWIIFWVNICLRPCWMLCLIPLYRISATGDIEHTLSREIYSYLGVFITLAEIGRRTLWTILRVELQSIKLTDPTYGEKQNNISSHLEFAQKRCWMSFASLFVRESTSSVIAQDHDKETSLSETSWSICQDRCLILEIVCWKLVFVLSSCKIYFW